MNREITYYSQLAWQAMLQEVNLTPKPGLVDQNSNGAHRDMSLHHFHASADAIAPYFLQFIQAGQQTAQLPETTILVHIRPIGLACEQAMFLATKQINTHKGSIFSLGLVCVAIGRIMALNQQVTTELICHYVAKFCAGMIARELQQQNERLTAGQRLFIDHGLTGARGEAESGFKTVLTVSLPCYCDVLIQTKNNEQALHQALLSLMATNQDTNVVSRGGLSSLLWLQQQAQLFLDQGGVFQSDYLEQLEQFDQRCIEKNLSPGGSADLLILTWFFGHID